MKVYDWKLTGSQAGGTGRSGAAGTERAQETRQTERAGGVRPAGAAPGADADRVEFSNSLSRLNHVLSVDNAGRAARVQQLEAQYRAGAYQPDAAGAARGMIDEGLAG